MEKLLIEQTETSPGVTFDPVSQTYEILGRSYPENPVGLFDAILEYITKIFPTIEHSIRLSVEADYFNSVSSRYLLAILRKLAEISKSGKNITVVWIYEDDDTLRDGEMFQNLVNLPFEFILNEDTSE